MKDYRSYSLWLDGLGELKPRPALPGPTDVDVAIVGAGLTGLWTAYYLKKADPALRVCVLEKEVAGFGASGRNGGWCSPFFAAYKSQIAKKYGRDAALRMQAAMVATVDEVGRVVAAEGIDARYVKGGCMTLATNPVQLARVREEVESEREWGATEDDWRLLTAPEARQRINAVGVLGASYTPHCAAVDPARLTRGLADVVEKLGVPVYELTTALAVAPGRVETSSGTVKAEIVVRALEAYTTSLPGYERDLLPIYSLMIGTEPLPKEFWDECGWSGHETFTDSRHMIIYVMRTQDDRIAMGGRGAPYHFGSLVRDDFDRDPRIFAMLHRSLKELFPMLGDARITNTWGGPLGVPRDWFTSVGFDRETGLAWCGGYVGDGVSTTNLGGRTLAGLVTGTESDLVGLPWVGHRSRKWEPEPLRWLGANLSLKTLTWGDNEEARTGKPSRIAALSAKVIGR
jgi:glycine/D-amino acid oxidase-like deaminating enzyme